MPRSNRSHRSRRHITQAHNDDHDQDLSYLTQGWRRTESRSGVEWNVQPISAARALKEYRCPSCNRGIGINEEHVVVWRADGVLGDNADLAARRHWHAHCWRVG